MTWWREKVRLEVFLVVLPGCLGFNVRDSGVVEAEERILNERRVLRDGNTRSHVILHDHIPTYLETFQGSCGLYFSGRALYKFQQFNFSVAHNLSHTCSYKDIYQAWPRF